MQRFRPISPNSPELQSPISQWKLFDLLNFSSPKNTQNIDINYEDYVEEEKEASAKMAIINCVCCGTILSYPQTSLKFKCSICHTTNILQDFSTYFTVQDDLHLISSKYITKLIDKCLNENMNTDHKLHEVFEPLSTYLFNAFNSYTCLNKSFKLKPSSTKIHFSTSNINNHDIHLAFNLLTKLPTKRPIYMALYGCLSLLKRSPILYGEDARNYRWLLILLEIPFLSHSMTHYRTPKPELIRMIDVEEIKSLSYDILKRVLGILAGINSVKVTNYFISWFSKYSTDDFVSKIDLINVYITFHLQRYLHLANNPEFKRRRGSQVNNESQEYFDTLQIKQDLDSNNTTSLPIINFGFKQKNNSNKIKIFQYGNDWHLKTASLVLKLLGKAYDMRNDGLLHSIFYNSLVDYVNIKTDFDSWVSHKRFNETKLGSKLQHPELSTVLEYINGTRNNYSNSATFFFCKYPFLITLGHKISIMEYEAKRIMERKAEEAFITSLDQRIPIDIYFRVKVRRDYIVQDSLKCIQLNQGNLKKSLKVQFIDEPGIDAGGLKKEWFLILTKSIFSHQTGLLVNIEESNYLWFNLLPFENNLEIYYLFGAILGLAIYNSTILDLNFPKAFYKLLLDLPIGFSDFQELHPETSVNLFKLKHMTEEELIAMDLTFEVTISDIFGNYVTRELIPKGLTVSVTCKNCDLYIEKYAKYYVIDGISQQLNQFCKGFKLVTNGNALKLFSPDEIKLLLCGDDEGKLNLDNLRSITRYRNIQNDDKLIDWIWDILQLLDYHEQKKFLIFVTGSDRIPATGIQNLNLTIKLIGKDSDRLPISHTCFNELDIYEYKTREKLYEKLMMAINESGGFGIK